MKYDDASWHYGGDFPHDLHDYAEALGNGLPSMYQVADTWENYDKLAPAINSAFGRWSKKS